MVLTLKDIPAFLDSARESPYYVYFCLLLTTGLRFGETLALRWCSFDQNLTALSVTETTRKLDNGKYIIKQPKTRRSRRLVTLPQSLTNLLTGYKAAKESV
jgi:integrase